MDDPILVVDDVRREFDGGTIVALDGVSLAIGRGELAGVYGSNGSGKSTLLNIMAGLDLPTGGSVTFAGHRAPGSDEWTALRAGAIGMIFQDFNLLPTLTASENVQIAMFGAVRSAAERLRRASALLEEVGITHCAGRLPPQLSGGERQRVSIARSLANHPELLLADEPTSNLDTKAGAAVTDLLIDLQKVRGIALVIVTHQPALLERCPRRIGLMDGKVIHDVRD
ncbi:ABC transporter ATP-binding protein [Sphingomonas sp. RT2P30]|uniref:ABC transporter ATP-binding protein n=1 Tax=Parasphingomonas halimpatiens TaxID=3096162 RepID=UPI002FC5C5CD